MTRKPDRIAKLLSHRPAHGTSVEVAPYFNPALPKVAGHDVLILDVFDTVTLRSRATEDQNIPTSLIDEIEDVDIVGDASAIGELLAAKGLTGSIAFVVSSHNFEHLPNPIRFLQGVEESLMPGGVLSMAIPDCRATFDHFRSPTRLIDWLIAYHDGYRQPTSDSLFDLQANRAGFPVGATMSGSCDWGTENLQDARLVGDLRVAYDTWLESRRATREYTDCHVSVVFDAQFALLIEDLRFLGLIGLEVIEVTPNHGHEFFAHLRRPVSKAPQISQVAYMNRREILLRRIAAGLGDCASPGARGLFSTWRQPKAMVRKIVGKQIFDRVKVWNRARKARRTH